MSSTQVSFHGTFSYRGQYPVSPGELGRDIVNTLFRGAFYADFGCTPDAAVDILRHTGRHGKLAFDMQQDPWPLVGWEHSESQRLRDQADQLDQIASSLSDSAANQPCIELRGGRVEDTLELSANRLRRHAGSLYGSQYKDGPLARRYQLPRLKRAHSFAGARDISWDARARVWQFGTTQVGTKLVGRLIATTLMRGHELVSIGGIGVSVNYLVEMVRMTGRYGRFYERAGTSFNIYAPGSDSRRARR